MASNYSKTCPECGAENDSNDLFCRECGTSLAGVSDASQQTAAFTPVTNGSETQTTSIAPAPPPVADDYTAMPLENQTSYSYMPRQASESARGAVLGWMAATLMLLIIAAFLWSSVISDATRDRITGIF